MRLAAKTSIAVLAFYLIALTGFGLWLQFRLSMVATTLVRNTARLIGSEIAKAVSGAAIEEILQGKKADREAFNRIVAELSEESVVIGSISVINAEGKVIASDELQAGHTLVPPQLIFQGKKKVELASPDILSGGSYYLFVALSPKDEPIGYLRLSIKSERIAKLFQRFRREFLFAAALGLVGVVGLGMLIHYNLSRRSELLALALEKAVKGDATVLPGKKDEFTKAIDAARRVGQELSVAREERFQAHRRFGALMKVMDVGVLLLDSDENLDFANTPARELLDCPDGGDMTECWKEVRETLDHPLSLWAGRETSGATRLDLELPSNGTPKHLRLEIYRLDDESEGYLVLVKSREMMEALEKELGLAIQMRGLGRFYAAFAHDLKAPLNAMSMNLELLDQAILKAQTDEEPTFERQQRYVRVLRNEVFRLDRELRTLLSHASTPTDTVEEFDLRELIHDLASVLDPQARRQRITFSAVLPEGGVLFTGHRDRLKQALLNIVINALEAMPDGGKLSVELKGEGGQVQISVRDTGPGIPEDLQRKIYDMSFTTKSGGSGVGLFVANSVVQSYGGLIHIDSSPGDGTCFHIFLPVAAVSRASVG
jgi:signal transduction histidine kinase